LVLEIGLGVWGLRFGVSGFRFGFRGCRGQTHPGAASRSRSNTRPPPSDETNSTAKRRRSSFATAFPRPPPLPSPPRTGSASPPMLLLRCSASLGSPAFSATGRGARSSSSSSLNAACGDAVSPGEQAAGAPARGSVAGVAVLKGARCGEGSACKGGGLCQATSAPGNILNGRTV
jgi:hypothetical protein